MSDLLNPALDPAAFADQVLRRPLWPHQIEFARSKAKFKTVNAGRQVGKSEVLAVTALFEAATRANIFVLILSAGEAASRRLLATAAQLASRSDLLRGSVADESKSTIVLSNGSTIMSIPASERQARGWSADCLILDEAAFIGEDIFNAVEPVTIARPGSKIILASTPFSTDHFFYRLWRRGMDTPDARYASFHWPSSISPLISATDLEDLRQRTNPLIFNREYLAEFTDSQGALLTPEEISRAIVDYDFIDPELVERQGYWKTKHYAFGQSETIYNLPPVVGGIDYGKRQDAQALVLLGILDDNGVNVKQATSKNAGDYIFWIPWLEYHHDMGYEPWAERIVEVCTGYHVRSLASEANGVGSAATEMLETLMGRALDDGRLPLWDGRYSTHVAAVWTDNRRKQRMFGRLKAMLQSGKLILPRHPELLQQLAGLEMTLSEAGNTKIEVPAARGHDDIADALGQALASIGNTSRDPQQRYRARPTDRPEEEFIETPGGLLVPKNLRLLDPDNPYAFIRGSYGEDQEMSW